MSCGDRVDMFRISAFATGAKGTTKLNADDLYRNSHVLDPSTVHPNRR
jgi:hypothetical protein